MSAHNDISLPRLSIEASTTLYPSGHRLYSPNPLALRERENQLLAALQALAAAEAKLAEVEKERDDLRNAMIYAGRYAGCFLRETVSTAFLLRVPDEICAVLDKLRGKVCSLEK